MSANATLLSGTGLFKAYGKIDVLRGVDVTVGPDEAHVVIGPNGAGKTTLFKVLTGEVSTSRGRIEFQGEDVTRLPAHQRVHRGFGRTFQVARVFAKLTVRDNLQLACEARSRRRNPVAGLSAQSAGAIEDEITALLAEAGLQRQADAIAGTLAYGDRKRLELAMVLALQPALLFLDEPTAGMSSAERRSTVELLRAVRQRRRLAMLLTEHDMDVVFGLADRISVLHYGELIASGTPEQIRADPRVREVYLGDEDSHA
ncbi:ABC transporter ATP-binding protein [Caenimonas soli]|uniref:ABC transporter ATP-binding protein n=1 Tax=Caenimonas soli TaxID=2735555 RepID=UPI001553C061|nr:ABC transporter ATP-binding protein [Caenimonas soli]NPC56687.1 ABC transporter ATP-binding protein [Caenimonas soli]